MTGISSLKVSFQSQETCIQVLSTLCIGSRSQGKMLYSADPHCVYKHGIVPISKDAGKIK